MYLADAISGPAIGLGPGVACTLIIVLRHEIGEDFDFQRAITSAENSGWLDVSITEAAFVADDTAPYPGFEAQLQETYQGALDNGYHVLFFYDRH